MISLESRMTAWLAQSVEREAFNLEVGGSTPPSGDFLIIHTSCNVWYVSIQ